jgi:hypothetical protein
MAEFSEGYFVSGRLTSFATRGDHTMNRWIRFTALVATFTLSGCATAVNVQRASTLGKGNFEGGIEPGIWGGVGANGSVATIAAPIIPHVDFAFRYGLAERFDLGIRLGSSFVEAQFKGMFTDPDSRFVVSLAPQVGGIFIGGVSTTSGGSSGSAGILNIGVPVLFGYKWGDGHEFVLSPRVQNWLVIGGGVTGYVLGVGGSIGNAFQLGENFAIMPEVGVVAPVFGSAASGATAASAGLSSSVIYTFKLGLLIGRTRNGQTRNRAPAEELPPPPPPPAAVAPSGV